jgi:hypothetical protein
MPEGDHASTPSKDAQRDPCQLSLPEDGHRRNSGYPDDERDDHGDDGVTILWQLYVSEVCILTTKVANPTTRLSRVVGSGRFLIAAGDLGFANHAHRP